LYEKVILSATQGPLTLSSVSVTVIIFIGRLDKFLIPQLG